MTDVEITEVRGVFGHVERVVNFVSIDAHDLLSVDADGFQHGQDLLAGLMIKTRLLEVDQAPNRRDHRGDHPGDRLDDGHLSSTSMKSSSSRRRYSSHPRMTILQDDWRGPCGRAGVQSDLVLDVSQSVETQLGRPLYQRRSDLSRR